MFADLKQFFAVSDRKNAVGRGSELHRSMLGLFVSRETANTYAAQLACVLLVGLGYYIGNMAAIGIASIHFLLDDIVRRTLRKLDRALKSGDDVLRLEWRLTVIFTGVGFIWAMVSWPAYTATAIDGPRLLMAVMAPAGLILMANTTCFAPRVFRATTIGFALGMATICVYAVAMWWAVLAAATLGLLHIVSKVAEGIVSDIRAMFEAQQQRNSALAAQERTIAELDIARHAANALALTDSLTELPNRKAFLEHLTAMIDGGKPFTLMLLDVDLFKNVNDSLGHHIGDAVLRRVSEALRAATPRGSFASRLGGDEFAVLLAGRRDHAAIAAFHAELTRRLVDAVPGEFDLPNVSLTAGSARFPVDGPAQATLLSSADMAQREAKRAHRGSHQPYRSTLADAFQRESHIADLLSRSIEHGLIAVHFQPKIDLKSGRIAGAEALTRFTDPGFAAIAIDEIFEVAERRGLGLALADCTLAAIGAELAVMQAQVSFALPVAINLSQSSLKIPDRLIARLEGFVAQGLSPAAIRLEITEDAISGRGLDTVADTLTRIVAMGFSLSLDDFGTGQASMAHLKCLPISEIKIDKGFVRGVRTDRKDRAIIRGIIAMCRHLHIDCVAEGIETQEQADDLRSLGATIGQGFLWAPALPTTAFADFAHLFHAKQAAPRRSAARRTA